MGDAVGGTYTLVLSAPEPITVTVGALGTRRLPEGGYAYTGSALGSGAFSRVDRHRRVAAGDHDVRHWHVDYLAGHEGVTLVDVAKLAGGDVECRVADALADGPVEGFGASDCGAVHTWPPTTPSTPPVRRSGTRTRRCHAGVDPDTPTHPERDG